MDKLILIRHAETDWNACGRFQGKTDTSLSELGKKQAAFLAERLKGVKIDCVYSSPLKRALDTAAPFADEKGLDIVHRAELREIDFGRWEGLTVSEIESLYPDELRQCWNNPFEHGFRFGLSFDDVKRTVSGFLNECVDVDDEKTIAIVSHSVILKMIISVSMDFPPRFFHSFRIDNCAVTVIGPSHENKAILKLNDTGSI